MSKGILEKDLGHHFITSSSSHFFKKKKNDFEQYLFKVVAGFLFYKDFNFKTAKEILLFRLKLPLSCLPHTMEASHCPFNAKLEAWKLCMPIFIVFGLNYFHSVWFKLCPRSLTSTIPVLGLKRCVLDPTSEPLYCRSVILLH